jgi:HEAT repeat protein
MQTTKSDRRPESAFQDADVGELVTKLGSHDGLERQRARETLVAQGEPAIQALIAALSAGRDIVRWEAAKALTELHALAAAPALVNTLMDDDGDVRWLAADALIGLGEDALVPLFDLLTSRAESVELREGAHHVLHALNHRPLIEIVEPVLATLEGCEPELAVPFSADVALTRLKKREDWRRTANT